METLVAGALTVVTCAQEEKAKLLKELAVLHSRMEDIKVRALRSSEEKEQDERQKLFANRVLRRAVQSQQVDLAHVHGLMSEYFLFVRLPPHRASKRNASSPYSLGLCVAHCQCLEQDTQAGSPIHRYIRLDKDKNRRHDVLMGMKSSVLSAAERFVHSRFPRLNPLKPMREEHCFEAPNGDYCSSYSAVTQLESAASVRHVYDAMQSFFCNIEISISERLGSITIREDDDRHISGLTQNRLVSSTSPSCLLMESNSILFSHCDDDDGQRGSAIIVSDFVDEDELYPYYPSLRARRDVSACLHFSTHSRPKPRADGTDDEQTETVVVLTHWVNLRLHYPGYNVTSSGWRELREHSERWLRTLQLVLHEANFSHAKPMSTFELL